MAVFALRSAFGTDSIGSSVRASRAFYRQSASGAPPGVRLLDILTRLGNEDDNLDLGLMPALQLGFQAGVVGGADTRVIKLPLVE
jgi:hypothetical protein